MYLSISSTAASVLLRGVPTGSSSSAKKMALSFSGKKIFGTYPKPYIERPNRSTTASAERSGRRRMARRKRR